jgi:phage shock protein PspC (stress-responsive transcriptional regulator)
MNTDTTHIPATRRLQRSRSDRMLAGVSGGLAEYFEIHPAVFRVGFVVLTLLGGAGLLVYAAAALVIPDEGKTDSIATAALRDRRDRPWPLIGLGLLAVGGALLLSRMTLLPDGGSWVLFLVAGALVLWVTRQAPSDPAKDATELAAEDSRRVRGVLKWTAVTIASLLALALVAVAVFLIAFHVHLDRGVGDRRYVVTEMQELKNEYRLGVGDLELDLSGLELPRGETVVKASVDVGDLQVIIPPDVGLRIEADAKAGYVNVLGETDDGRHADVDQIKSGDRMLVLDADAGAGSVRIERAVR